jgi:UTP-glucose-1-phosphate uridylyltransferase
MLPETKAIPKELLPVYDRPIIEHVVKEAIAAGITEIIVVTRSRKEAIENHFDAHYELEHRLEKKGKETILGTVKNIIPAGVKVTSIRQSDALGLGHAVLCAKHLLNDEPSAVLGLLETTVAGVGDEIQLTDALDELLKLDGLNAFETDADVFDCGNKRGFLRANLAVGMRDPATKLAIKALIEKSGW